jgi:hypothetical protein
MGQFKRLLETILEMQSQGLSEAEIARATRCPLDFVEYALAVHGESVTAE